MFWIPLAAGAALGAAKRQFVDKPREQKQWKLAAETQRYSPWTGLTAKMPEETSFLGNMMQGGAMGAMVGQGLSGAGLLGGGSAASTMTGANVQSFMDADNLAGFTAPMSGAAAGGGAAAPSLYGGGGSFWGKKLGSSKLGLPNLFDT